MPNFNSRKIDATTTSASLQQAIYGLPTVEKPFAFFTNLMDILKKFGKIYKS